MNADGGHQRLLYDGGAEIGMAVGFPVGAYDPEISPDNRRIVFSLTNTGYQNFQSSLNMAHDLYVMNVDGTGLNRITQPGPVSVIPDWDDTHIIYTEYNEHDNCVGLVSIKPDGSGKKRLEPSLDKLWDGGMNGKFIPE